MVVGEVDHRYKGINDLAPELLTVRIPAPEPLQPEDNLITFQMHMAQLFDLDGPLQIFAFAFQFQQPPLCGGGDDSGFDGSHHVIDGFFVFLQLGGQGGKLRRSRLPLLILHHGIRDPLHHVSPEDVVQSGLHDHPLDPLAGHVGLFTSPLPPPLLAAVVVMQFAALPGAGEADHVGPTVGTLQLPCQQIIPAALVAAPNAAVCFHPLIRRPERPPIYDGGHPAFDAGIRKMIHPDIRFILQEDEAVPIPAPAPAGFQSPTVQIVGDVHKGHPRRSLSEDLPHHLGVCFMDRKAAIRPLTISKRNRARVYLALLGVELHAPTNILSEGCAVIFGRPLQNRFQQDTLRAVRNVFFGVQYTDTVLLQAVFIGGAVIAVPGKAVQLPAYHKWPVPVGCVLEHLLELRPLVAGAGQVPVGVDLHDSEIVLSGEQLAVGHLLLDGAVALVVGGIAGIDNGILHIRLKHGRFLFCTHSEQPPAAHRGRLFYLDMSASAILTYFFAEMFPARNSCLHRSISACASSSAALLPLRLTFGQSSSIPSSEARR